MDDLLDTDRSAMSKDGSAPEGVQRLLELTYAAMRLKDEPRAGWVMHGIQEPESVAAHSWGTAYLCLLFATEAGVDPQRAVAMAVVHDIAEAKTGDFAARAATEDRAVTEAEKAELERAAVLELLPGAAAVLGGAAGPDSPAALWRAYEDRADAEAVFVRDMNLIDMCLQALRYEREARYDADVLIASRDSHRHLDEFFLSAEWRLSTPLAKRLFASIEAQYRLARG
jgi:putative hydrolase of HD superfamily